MFVAPTKEKLTSHLATTYKIKLQYNYFLKIQERKCCILALDFSLLMSIFFPHTIIVLQNITFWEITHHIIHIENQQFFWVQEDMTENTYVDFGHIKMDIDRKPKQNQKILVQLRIYKN
jgi:hypothetical protein